MENFIQRKKPAGSLTGLLFVAALHVAIVIAFMHGLVRNQNIYVPPPAVEWVSIIDPEPPKPKAQLPEPLSRQELPAVVPVGGGVRDLQR